MKKRSNLTLVLAVFLIAAIMLSKQFLPSAAPDTVADTGTETTIHFIDVGQGDASLIVSGDSAVLIDGGKQSAGDAVVDYLSRHGIADLDAVIATHPHEDHIGGLVDVFEAFDVRSVYLSDEAMDTRIYEKLLDAIDEEGIEPEFPDIGDTSPLGESGGVFTVLAPGPNSRDTYGNDPNTWSLVLRLDASGCSALFTGDTTTRVEQDMIKNTLSLLDCNVLKVAHHGSRTASSAEFLEAVSPEFAVISYEKGNSYGLPDEEVFERLEPIGTEIFETAKHGSVVLTMANGEVGVAS